MKKLFLFLALLPAILLGADSANDLLFTQRNPGNTGNIQRNIAASGAITSLATFKSQLDIPGTASPTFTGTITAANITLSGTLISPIYASAAADRADAGVFRLGNAELVAWESSPAGTDGTLTFNSSEQFVFSNAILSPTLVTPALGTPASGVATNLTGLPVSTGVAGLGTGMALWLATPSSANLITALTDETGTGAAVFANTPTLVTPVLGAATGTSLVLTGSITTGSGGSVGGYAALVQGTVTSAPASSVGFVAPTSVTTPYLMKLPAAPITGVMLHTGASDALSTVSFVAPSTSGNVLTSNGTTWTSAAAAGATPGGADTQIQFNDSGAFGGIANLVVNKTTGAVTSNSGYTAGNASAYQFTGRSFMSSSADGRIEFYNNGVSTKASIIGTILTDNAAAGGMGEIVVSAVAVGSAVSLTTATTANITSISLTAGDWDVSGNINFTAASATVSAMSGGITVTSATVPTDGTEAYSGVLLTVASAIDSITLPRKRVSISATTTVYLVARATFSAGTDAAFGSMTARRVR